MAELTQKEMIQRLYFVIEGRNGDGMAQKVDQLWEGRHAVMSRADCAAVQAKRADRKRSALSVAREVAQWLVMLLLGSGVIWKLLA